MSKCYKVAMLGGWKTDDGHEKLTCKNAGMQQRRPFLESFYIGPEPGSFGCFQADLAIWHKILGHRGRVRAQLSTSSATGEVAK